MDTDRSIEAALDRAWDKISNYCRQFAGKSTQDIRIRWRTDGDKWDEFGVTPNGEAFLVHGENSTADDPYCEEAWYYYHPLYTRFHEDSERYQSLEDLVRNWKDVKRLLKAEVDELNELFTFEV